MKQITPVGIPSLVFLIHAAMFTWWMVDDAGISFAYARSLATGYGLVSQPGVPPVEGYSNPLWVFLMAALYRLHLFSVLVTPKLVSCVLVIACFGLGARILTRRGGVSPWTAAVALTLLALNTPFVIWTTSGLENPLYVFLLAALTCCALEVVTHPRPSPLAAVTLGLLATALALTRPEGVIYAAAAPTLLLLAQAYRPARGRADLARRLLTYGATFVVTFGACLLFRWHYFGEIVPNTYYAKGTAYFAGAQYNEFEAPPAGGRVMDLVSSLGGLIGVGIAGWLVYATGALLVRRRFGKAHAALGVMLAYSLLVYLLLPPDWMKEYRFATPFFLFWYLFAVLVTTDFVNAPTRAPGRRRGVAVLLAAVALGVSGLIFSGRSLAFARAPEVDFLGVRGWMAARVDWYAEALGVAQGSALVPDVGATLWYSRLRIYDLGMLCDRTIAKTMRKDQAAFYDYVFEVAKPTLIHTHGTWTYQSRLDEDPRFRRDYVPIGEREEGWGAQGPLFSGDYVRKEVARGKEAELERLRQEGWWLERDRFTLAPEDRPR